MQIKDINNSDRPREKALLKGVNQLSDSELLAIVVKSGTKNNSSLQIAYELLKVANGIANLHLLSYNDLINIKGISKIRSIEFLATIEIAKRISFSKEDRIKITQPEHIVSFFGNKLRLEKQENFIVILLDSKGNMIHYKTVFIGSLNFSLVHPREVFGYIVSFSCASFICVHNHPSGCVHPSESDIEVTEKLYSISKLLQINMLDHIIVGDTEYFSFKENNLL